MPTSVRLYRVPLKPIALLGVGQDRIQLLRAFAPDPILDDIIGELTPLRAHRLRAALASDYVVTEHDPDDAHFREGNILPFNRVAALASDRG